MPPKATKRNIEDIYRLSPTQEGLLFHALHAPDRAVYFQQFTCALVGELDVDAFEKAFGEVTHRHDAVRALFTWERREHPLQVIRQRVTVPLVVEDWRRSDRDHDAHLESFLAKDRERGFKLEEAPLMRVALLRVAETEYRLVWSFHHLILDGWSQRLFFDEVLAHYETLRRSRSAIAAHRPVRGFGDYIAWLAKRDRAPAMAFWKRTLSGFDTPTNLRLPRPTAGSISQHTQRSRRLSSRLTEALRSTARAERVTLSTLVRGAWALLLARYSGSDDVVFGATVSGRSPELEGVEQMIGLFINTLPVRARLDGGASVGSWLRGLQAQQLEANPHEFMSLAEVQRVSEMSDGQPLFETIVVFENQPSPPRTGERTLQVRQPRYIERSNFPLALLVVPGAELEMILVYDEQRFTPVSIENLSCHFETILEAIADDPAQELAGVPLMTRVELHRILDEWGTAPPRSAVEHTVLDLFERTCTEKPDAVALIDGRQEIPYRELRSRAQSLARRLRARGVSSSDPVGICIDRSVEAIVGLLGVLYAGGAYVPLDSKWPRKRLSFVMKDSGAGAIVASRAQVSDLAGEFDCVEVSGHDGEDGAALPRPAADGLAYVLYTSGSTGQPKGVEVTHRNLVCSTAARFDVYLNPVSRFLLLSALTFDSSVAGIFWSLCQGGTLVLPAPGLEQDIRALSRLIAEKGITHTLCLPSLYRVLLEHAEATELESLETVVVAGEACPAVLWQMHRDKAPRALLFNEYGPTEATVWSTVFEASSEPNAPGIPIGRPIPGAAVYLLDDAGRPVPVGIPGEIHIAGAGLARGYRNRPALTDERFGQRRIDGDKCVRSYRTGDIARWREDGQLEFLGRSDGQVKILGYRIELEEIEVALASHRAIREVAVAAYTPGARTSVLGTNAAGLSTGRAAVLNASVVPNSSPPPSTRELRRFLEERLPDYMVPSSFSFVDTLPKTPTGKVDRKRLPAPQAPASPSAAAVRARTPAEETLAEIWADVLGVADVGLNDNFFEIGGDSLLSIRIIARARQAGLQITAKQFFEVPTVSGIAARATASETPSAPSPGATRRSPGVSPDDAGPREAGNEFPLADVDKDDLARIKELLDENPE